MRHVRIRFQFTHNCPFCEAVKYLVDELKSYGLEVIEEPIDVLKKTSYNVDVVNRKLIKQGNQPLPISSWVPVLIIDFLEDNVVKGRLVINVEEYVEINNRKYPCRVPYVHIGKYAKDFLEYTRETVYSIEDVVKHLDDVFGIDWRIGYMCLERYREIVNKILKICANWVLGR